MIKRICDLLIRMLEKHGELVLAWNGVKTAFYRLNSGCQNGIMICLKSSEISNHPHPKPPTQRNRRHGVGLPEGQHLTLLPMAGNPYR